MTSFDDVERRILRDKLLGRWVAEKMGLTGAHADSYSDALCVSALARDGGDVFTKIRKDLDAAGVAQSDEDILRAMTEMTLKAGNRMPTARGDSLDAAAVTIARNLMSR
jgi:hypothetical protein